MHPDAAPCNLRETDFLHRAFHVRESPMSGKGDSGRPLRGIGDAAKAAFLAGLRRGESREDAAAAAGFSLMGLYGARGRDPVFKAVT